jgi:hypothetical protein
VVRREATAGEVAQLNRAIEQARWDTTVTRRIALAITCEHASVVDCTFTGGGIWVNLGGVLRQVRGE